MIRSLHSRGLGSWQTLRILIKIPGIERGKYCQRCFNKVISSMLHGPGCSQFILSIRFPMKGCVFYRKQRTCREINYGDLCNLHSDGKGGSGNNDIGSKKKEQIIKIKRLYSFMGL